MTDKRLTYNHLIHLFDECPAPDVSAYGRLFQRRLNQLREAHQVTQQAIINAGASMTDKSNLAGKALLHQLIDQMELSNEDADIVAVILTAFWTTPPAALLQQLRCADESSATN